MSKYHHGKSDEKGELPELTHLEKAVFYVIGHDLLRDTKTAYVPIEAVQRKARSDMRGLVKKTVKKLCNMGYLGRRGSGSKTVHLSTPGFDYLKTLGNEEAELEERYAIQFKKKKK